VGESGFLKFNFKFHSKKTALDFLKKVIYSCIILFYMHKNGYVLCFEGAAMSLNSRILEVENPIYTIVSRLVGLEYPEHGKVTKPPMHM